jgi:glucosyl-3-phosphoglycerate synthase
MHLDAMPSTVLVPMLNLGVATDMIQLAGILAASPRPSHPFTRQGPPPRVVVVGVVEVPPDQPLATGLVMARSYRALLDFLPSETEVAGRRVRVDRVVKVARDVPSAVHDAALDERANLVLLYWKGYARQPKRHTYGGTADAILRNPPCDIALVRPERWRDSRRVLLPVRGGPSAERALTLALALAEGLNLPISVMHNVPSGSTGAPGSSSMVQARGEEPYIIFNQHLKAAEQDSGVPIERILTVGGDPASSLLAEARPSDFLIMGTPAPTLQVESRVQSPESGVVRSQARISDSGLGTLDSGLGPITHRVSEEKGPPLLLLRTPEPLDMAGYRRKVHVHKRSKGGWSDMPFEHWFVENTYHGDEFKDPEAFLEAKRRSGLTVSVGLLTSNDGEHIYSAILGLKRVLQEMHPIADQIAVIDAGSGDGTPDIARSLGAEVYTTSEILPEKGSLHGRGESWWKSLAVLRGDVIVWLDPRAQRFHPTTAMSLAGPLLRVPALQLVKAYGQPQDEKSEGRRNRKSQDAEPRNKSDYAPVDMSWGGFVMPVPGDDQVGQRIRVQALKPEDLQALDASQLASLPPRTILQVLFPGMAAVIHPFSRDMAGRRGAMLSLPAFMGDNLEIGLLLSVAAEYGTRAIAQVELRPGQPAPPPPPSLRNAIDLLQALAKRLQDPAMRRLAADTAEHLEKSINGHGATAPALEVRALGPVERPPMQPILAT